MAVITRAESLLLLEKPVILPAPGCKKVLGIDETVIERKDMTSFSAWYQLVHHGLKADIGEKDFVETRNWYKFFILSLGLCDFPVILLSGHRGGGKSLIASFLTYCNVQLFGKQATMEKPPPDPTKFGDHINYLHDQNYVDDIILGLARLDKIERETGKRPTEEDLQKCILYKAIFWCDEAHMWGEMSRTYQLTVLMNRLIMIARHLYMSMLFSYVDIERANKLIKPYATHVIICRKEWFPRYGKGICSFQITDIRPEGTMMSKFIHLNPMDWLDLWDSYNIPSVVRDVEIYLGGNSKKKSKTPALSFEAAAEQIENKRKNFTGG
jgi:hypothetical protein